MHIRWTSIAFLGAVWGLSPAVNAADEPLSYSVGDKCYCNLSSTSPLGRRMVGTPIGGQSVSQVCERIGKGPELTSTAGIFDHPVFDDAQCGHGPGLPGYVGLLNNSGNDSKGPKWDLAAAYGANGNRAESGSTSTASATSSNTSTTNESAEVASTNSGSSTGSVTRFKSRYLSLPTASEEGESDELAESATSEAVEQVSPTVEQADTKPVEIIESTPIKQATTKPATKVEAKPVQQAASSSSGDSASEIAQKSAEVNQPAIEEQAVAKTEPVRNESKTAASVATETPAEPVVDAEPTESSSEAEEVVAEAVTPKPESEGAAIKVPVSNAFVLPPQVRASSRNFEYVSLLPITYDFGGAGLQVAGSYKYLDNLGFNARAGLATDYQELALGASYIITPTNADRFTFELTGGLEFGRFNLEGQGVETTLTDTGIFGRAKSRFVINNQFEVQGGVGFSSFFDGDPHIFGAALYHLTRQLDITGEVEVGDNDSLGVGVRYYY